RTPRADGKRAAVPPPLAGGFRVRAVAPGDALARTKAAGEVLLALEVTAEPRLRCLEVAGVRVKAATDDAGQTLAQRLLPEKEKAAPAQPASITINGSPFRPGGQPLQSGGISGDDPRQAPVRLQAGAKPSKSVRDVRGSAVVLVQLPPEKLATVDGVLKSADQTVKGPAGSSLKVVEVSR